MMDEDVNRKAPVSDHKSLEIQRDGGETYLKVSAGGRRDSDSEYEVSNNDISVQPKFDGHFSPLETARFLSNVYSVTGKLDHRLWFSDTRSKL